MMLRITIHQVFLVSFVEVPIKDLSVKPGTRLSMNKFLVTLRNLRMTKFHIIHMMTHINISLTVVSTVEGPISSLIVKQGIHFLVTIMTFRIMTNLHSTK